MSKTDKACEALFSGRVNVPRAALACDLSTQDMKTVFSAYVSNRRSDDWELDIVLCWPYA